MNFRLLEATLLISMAFAAGCSRADASASADTSQPAAGSASAAVAANPAAQPVAQIVFIDKEKCCDCTKARIDGSWKALQDALGKDPKVTVARVHIDTQSELAKQYTSVKPLMVPPGIYFMSASGDVIKQLQGEVKTAEIAAVLGK
jgi:hypothetical protein